MNYQGKSKDELVKEIKELNQELSSLKASYEKLIQPWKI